MPDFPPVSSVTELELALTSSRPDRAADVALRAFRANTTSLEILRVAANVAASRYDPASGLAPHALAALAAANGLRDVMEPRTHILALLQSAVLAAAEKKLPAPQAAASVVSGEVSHLGRSALLALRASDLRDAESVFLGIVDEGWERRMAGEILFRASVEDPGESGHKLLTSVAAWRLARALGFHNARTLLRPAVQYQVNGEPARRTHEAIVTLMAKEWVDLDALVAGGKPLDDGARARLASSLAMASEESCLASILELLQDGYAATSLAEGVGIEASKRLVAAEGYHPELAHALLGAHAARFVLEYSRSSERIAALLQAAARVRSPAPRLPSVAVSPPAGQEDGLRQVADDLGARRPREAAAHARIYLAEGHPPKRLVATLAYHACLDSSLANQGHNLLLADACAAEHTATKAPDFLIALAKSVAASPKDVAASKAWIAALGL